MIFSALIVLGVLASVILVFSTSVQLLRVGVVTALWAAIVGAIAMTKFRREATIGTAKSRDLQTVYELQLEREISARREFEMRVESRVRREVRADAEELSGLRAELAALRKHLQVLFDGKLPEDLPAVRADARRVGELEPGQGGAPAPAYSEANEMAPLFATPLDAPVTAETSIIITPELLAEMDSEQSAEAARKAAAEGGDADGVADVEDAEVVDEPGAVQPGVKATDSGPGVTGAAAVETVADSADSDTPDAGVNVSNDSAGGPVVGDRGPGDGGSQKKKTKKPSAQKPAVQKPVVQQPAVQKPVAETRGPGGTIEPRRRRRADADQGELTGTHATGGLSVAQILANLRAEGVEINRRK